MTFLPSMQNISSNLTTSLSASPSVASEFPLQHAASDSTAIPSSFTDAGESALNTLVAGLTTAAYDLSTKWMASNLSAPTYLPTAAAPAAANGSANGSWTYYDTFAHQWLGNLTNFSNTVDTDEYFDYEPCSPDNPNFNCSRDDFLKYSQGPQMLALHKALLVTIIFGGIFITGMLGNLLVCVVIVRHSTMHTATNYYLFSLAVSDLLYLLFGLPAEVFLYWHQYPYLFGLPFCKIRAFISEASTYVSVLTIVAFSMERFLAICHPLHLYAMSGFKRAVRIIAALWFISFLSAIPFGWMTGITYARYPKDNTEISESAFCAMIHNPDYHGALFELSFCVFFVIPMILIIILYGRMGAQIRSRTTQQLGVQQGSMHKESRHQQSRKAVIRMLAAVVITFFVCWLPFHMQRLWFLYAPNFESQEINEWIFSITGFTYYVSCTINPILYNVMSHRYRVAFKDILCGKRKSVYYNNGFARDQSSFRETTIATTLGGNGTYDRVHSVRVRSMRHLNNVKDRESIKSNSGVWMKKAEFSVPLQADIPEDTTSLGTNVVVVVDNGVNGRPKVYTENDVQETLLTQSNDETCI